jgi:hypothetical protein
MFGMLCLEKSWLCPVPILSNVTSKRVNSSKVGERHREVSPKIYYGCFDVRELT